MNLVEFYEAFKIAAPKFKWNHLITEFIWGNTDFVDGEFCTITSVYYDRTGIYMWVGYVNEAADLLNISTRDRQIIMSATDNGLMKDISVEERDRCRAKLLQITGLNNASHAATESNARDSHEGSR